LYDLMNQYKKLKASAHLAFPTVQSAYSRNFSKEIQNTLINLTESNSHPHISPLRPEFRVNSHSNLPSDGSKYVSMRNEIHLVDRQRLTDVLKI
jgi:hypothetical protein